MTRNIYLGIDIGGTWLKGIAFEMANGTSIMEIPYMVENIPIVKEKSRLSEGSSVSEFIEVLNQLTSKLLNPGDVVKGIAISTPGIVDYQGKKLMAAAKHLQPLMDSKWLDYLEQRFHSSIIIINDAEAAAIGAASLGYLKGNQVIGIMPIGTGLGFSVWRNARRWTPNYSLNLLGSIYTPNGYYDSLASASALSKYDKNNKLKNIFTQNEHDNLRKKYIKNLSGIISAAHVMYGVNKILIGGGLAEAVSQIAFPLDHLIMEELNREPLLSSHQVEVTVMPQGNMLPLIGVALLAIAEEKAQSFRQQKEYTSFNTEKPYLPDIHLEELDLTELVRVLWKAEQEAGLNLELSIPEITEVVKEITQKLQSGGRLIYVGAGTSGRLAAIDTVEIACTFGFPRERVLTFIAGGIADAAIDIETRFEEDASSVPDLLYANINKNDIVIGISASGSAYYVQSALGYAKSIGASSIMIQEGADGHLPFCDKLINLRSGNEVIAGSTRMKAGTATKKVLNFISTSTMTQLGKIHGCYMTDLECINEKLIKRAAHILKSLFDIDEKSAHDQLKKQDYNLNKTIHSLKNLS